MNTIAFRIVPTPLDYGPGIEIRIDGEDLINLVRGVELPFAQAEGHPGIAGAYAGLPAGVYSRPSRHFWGEAGHGRRDGKVELLTCRDCGEMGCWPLLARIELRPSQVVWSEFEQPHRRVQERSLAWTYEGFGPFEFDRGQYEQALQMLAREGG
jgi:hypothetical protein